ncbi:AFG1/ZapE family ATPase [Shigella flexneri]
MRAGGGETRKFTNVESTIGHWRQWASRSQALAYSFSLCIDAAVSMTILRSRVSLVPVMLFDVPVMTRLMESEARRFIALVDEFTSAMSN